MYPNTQLNNYEEIHEQEGSLANDAEEDKLMRSVMNNDKKTVDDGKLIMDALNNSIGTFNPDLMFESIVSNFKQAKEIYGEKLIREVSGYDNEYIERNRKIPEFKKELKNKISSKISELRKSELIDKDFEITEKAISLSAIVMYMEELDKLKVFGSDGKKDNNIVNKINKKGQIMPYKKGSRYKDINLRSSIKTAIRRNHQNLKIEDLKIEDKDSKGKIKIIYAIDASASMKGKKIEMAKKAGIALSFNACNDKNEVGLIVFGDEIKDELKPTNNFKLILNQIAKIKPSRQTNIAKSIERAYELFDNNNLTKHLIIITDAMPTTGDDPINETIKECFNAYKQNITTSIIGIDLDKEGIKTSKKISEAGNGRLHLINDTNNLDILILEEYHSLGK
ncbi:MAG: vWA domain-containing protein [Candidatus Woesearchaeota archaeon]